MSENNSTKLYLPVSIILSALIFSGTIFFTGSQVGASLENLSKGISNIQIAAPSQNNQGTENAVIAQQPDQAPAQAPEIKGLLQGAAGALGSPTAPVVIVEYSDYQCPFCRKWVEESKTQLDKDYIQTGKVQLIYKDFPLSFHPMAPKYAEAARCSGDQEKYWEMHDKIYAEQGKLGQGTISSLTLDDVKKWANDLGLKTNEFNSCLDTGKYAQQVQANFAEGGQVGVSGTPSFVIGKRDGTGQLIVGAQPYSVFKSTIESLLK